MHKCFKIDSSDSTNKMNEINVAKMQKNFCKMKLFIND